MRTRKNHKMTKEQRVSRLEYYHELTEDELTSTLKAYADEMSPALRARLEVIRLRCQTRRDAQAATFVGENNHGTNQERMAAITVAMTESKFEAKRG